MASSLTSKVNKFPNFRDGDVLVVISPRNTYQLHARTLRLHSPIFARMLSEENAAQLGSRAKKEGITTRWRIDLKLPPESASEANGWGELFPRVTRPVASSRPSHSETLTKLQKLDERGRAPSSNTNPDIDAGLVQEPTYKHYDNILRAFYSEPLQLNHKQIRFAVQDCHAVIDIAERLQCMSIVTMPVDNALVRFGQNLWHSIASGPASWANLAFRLKSELLYREAVIHLVGRYPGRFSDDPSIRCVDFSTLKPEILGLVKRKHNELDLKKKSVETRIMGHYPPHIQKPSPAMANVGAGSITKRGYGVSTRVQDYQRDIHGWMAMCLFRHWVGQHMSNDGARLAPDGGWKFYDAISRGYDAYIDHTSIEGFTQFFPLSAKARSCFEEELGKLKDSIKSYVVSLLDNKLHLDAKQEKLGYLTCTEVERDDLPWKHVRRQEHAPRPLSPFHDEDFEIDHRSHGRTHKSQDADRFMQFSPPARASKRKRDDTEALNRSAGPFQQSDSEQEDGGMPEEIRPRKKKHSKKTHKGSAYQSQLSQNARRYPEKQHESRVAARTADGDEDKEKEEEYTLAQPNGHAAMTKDFEGRHDDVYSMDENGDSDEDANGDDDQGPEEANSDAGESDLEINRSMQDAALESSEDEDEGDLDELDDAESLESVEE